jgi:hypothetical protein
MKNQTKYASLVLSLAAAMFFAACSDSSDSGNPAQSGEENNPQQDVPPANASQCDLATAKLPASSLAWQPTFAGGCEVTQQFPLAELQALDQQLIAMGYEKKALTQESYIYSLNNNDFDNMKVYNDTLRFTYASEFFSGNFNAAERAMTQDEVYKLAILDACPTLLPAGFLYENFNPCLTVATYNKEWTGTNNSKYGTAASLTQALGGLGWSCSSTPVAGRGYTSIDCSASLEGKKYTLLIDQRQDGIILTVLIKYTGKV